MCCPGESRPHKRKCRASCSSPTYSANSPRRPIPRAALNRFIPSFRCISIKRPVLACSRRMSYSGPYRRRQVLARFSMRFASCAIETESCSISTVAPLFMARYGVRRALLFRYSMRFTSLILDPPHCVTRCSPNPESDDCHLDLKIHTTKTGDNTLNRDRHRSPAPHLLRSY